MNARNKEQWHGDCVKINQKNFKLKKMGSGTRGGGTRGNGARGGARGGGACAGGAWSGGAFGSVPSSY